jgi:hypothetical protein
MIFWYIFNRRLDGCQCHSGGFAGAINLLTFPPAEQMLHQTCSQMLII